LAKDLIVKQGTTLVLNEKPPADLAPSLKKAEIKTFNDLVNHGVLTDDNLDELLKAAKKVTTEALTRRETFHPRVRVPGTLRPDLRRFGAFMAAAPGFHRSEYNTFWRIARSIEPNKIESVTKSTNIKSVLMPSAIAGWKIPIKYLFNDVTVEPGATLTIASTISQFECHDLLIKKTGVIKVEGSCFFKCNSMEGEQ